MKQMPPTQFIVHNGQQILLIDFSNISSTADLIQTVEEAKKFVALHRPQSLLVLVDFTGMKIDRQKTKIIKGMAAHNNPYIRFIALVGFGSVRSIAFRVMLLLSGKKNHMVFGSREFALDWLVAMVE